MNLDERRAGWDQAARDDAMGHILTSGDNWSTERFFDTGRAEIDHVMARLQELGLYGRHKRALDFGCGIGRLTQALADHYIRVDGVDIAPSMVDQADKLNRHPKRVRYHRLDQLPKWWNGVFDLVYSNLVLQHMPHEYAHGYIADFVRILRPDGVAIFEIPDGPDLPHAVACLSMYSTPRETVERVVGDAGGEVVDVELIYEPSAWHCFRYTAVRDGR